MNEMDKDFAIIHKMGAILQTREATAEEVAAAYSASSFQAVQPMTKERLRAYSSLATERDQIRQMIEEIEADLYSPKIPRLDAVPGGGQKVGGVTPTDAKIDKRDELLALYAEKCAQLDEELLAIEQAIDRLEPREKTLLRLHYVKGLTWENVCVEMNYSWRQVHRIHAKALEKLKEA